MANSETSGDRRKRVAMISFHTSPRDQPGTGDSGGMNVYILSVAERLAQQGIAVDIFTRCHGQGGPQVEEIGRGSRLIQVKAGPCAPVPKEHLPSVLPEFLDGVIEYAAANPADTATHRHSPYDVLHTHYWLSGWVGGRAKRIWGAPLVASFHTLGRVKNRSLDERDLPEPPLRLAGEQQVIDGADRILAPTPAEARHLVDLYAADPGRIRIVPPGVDRGLFLKKDRAEARARLHLSNVRLLLFVGRLQPFKGPDVAIRALASGLATSPEVMRDVVLAIVGGPSGPPSEHDEVSRLMALAYGTGVGDRVLFFPPQPHHRLADFYSASEAVLMPSRSESFGLVALESQACGTPVIAAAAGGLRYAVVDGETGFLIEGHNPDDYADRMIRLLTDPVLAQRLSSGAMAHAGRFSWEATAAEVGDVYRELVRTRYSRT
jgi:D-inositol-3-phosphate glycosyltransferase